MSNRLTKLLFMGFFLMAAMFVGSAFANDVGPPDIYLECNEEDVIEGCGVEVKCYNQDIDGEFYLWFENRSLSMHTLSGMTTIFCYVEAKKCMATLFLSSSINALRTRKAVTTKAI